MPSLVLVSRLSADTASTAVQEGIPSTTELSGTVWWHLSTLTDYDQRLLDNGHITALCCTDFISNRVAVSRVGKGLRSAALQVNWERTAG